MTLHGKVSIQFKTDYFKLDNFASMYADAGINLDIALQLAQSAKAQMPDHPDVDDTLGWVYYKKDMANLAIRPLETSVSQEPTNALYHYHLGLAYAKTGNTTKARKSLEQALKLQPGFPGAADARSTLASLKE